MKYRTKQKGFLMAEVVVTITLLVMLLTTLAVAIGATRKFNKYQLVSQQCIAAAQGQLDSISVTGSPIDQDDLERLWPKIKVETQVLQGKETWEGLDLVTVTASGRSLNRSKDVKAELSRYIAKRKVQTK